jgi:hypothetical protein
MNDLMHPFEMRARHRVMGVCVECGCRPTDMQYELLEGPRRGVHQYCEDCAQELGMLLSTGFAALELGVNERTMRTWCKSGRVEAFKSDSTNRWWVLCSPHDFKVVDGRSLDN